MSEPAAETAVGRLQNRLPASLYEVAWQYTLFDWYDTTQSDALDWDLDPEYLTYLTPRAKNGLFGADDSLVVVYADLSDLSAPSLRSDAEGGPVEIRTLTEADRFRVGHSYPENKTSNMTDYSITTYKHASAHHIAGLRDDAYWTNNIQDRFTDWAQSDYADRVRESASEEDIAILDALAELGNDDEAMKTLSEAFLSLVESEDDDIDALITVAVKLPDAPDYRLPGEVDVLNEVMRVKKSSRLESVSVEEASGEGIGFVSDRTERVTGGSPGLFGMYGKLQREHFPNLDTDGGSAWRARPVSFDTAAAIATAGSLFDDFSRRLGENGRVYILPYLSARQDDLTTDEFRWFYSRVYKRIQSADGGSEGTFDEEVEEMMIEVGNAGETTGDGAAQPLINAPSQAAWDRVRVAIVHELPGNPDRVFFDTIDGASPALALENAHNQITGSATFRGDGIFAQSPSPESSPLLGRALSLTRYILYGGYFQRTTEPTRSSREADGNPTAGGLDNSRMRRVRRLLTDTRIDGQELIEEYLHQLVQDQRDQFGTDSPYPDFPVRSLVEQYLQRRALATAGVLAPATLATGSTPMPDDFDDRTERLDAFIESHDALAADAEEAVFVLGGLVGRITAYQTYKNISSTLVRRYPIDYLTKQTIKEVTKEVLQMNNDYAEADDQRSYHTNQRYTARLASTMARADPESWALTDVDLQWLYSLGIAYGLEDSQIDDEQTETEAATQAELPDND